MSSLNEQVEQTCRNTVVRVPSASSTDCPTPNPKVVVNSNDKLVLGEIERVLLRDSQVSVQARMDTGASSSSLDAKSLEHFERDGADWVRFQLDDNSEDKTIERPVKRYVRVFQQADKEGSRRPVVELGIQLGNVRGTFEFTLADRSHLEHTMILGRNFLTDMAVVDVSQKFVQSK